LYVLCIFVFSPASDVTRIWIWLARFSDLTQSLTGCGHVTNRMQQIAHSCQLSSVQSVLFGVPPRSVLDQLLYVLYRVELALVVNCHGLSLQHADDTQWHRFTSAHWPVTGCCPTSHCMSRWHRGMVSLNPTKTQQLAKVNVLEVSVVLARIDVSETVCNLGVVVDSQLWLTAQVVAVCCYQLRQLRLFIRLMSSDAIKTLAQAFILCCLEYFNSMFCGIIDGLMSRLQSVRNVAVH